MVKAEHTGSPPTTLCTGNEVINFSKKERCEMSHENGVLLEREDSVRRGDVWFVYCFEYKADIAAL